MTGYPEVMQTLDGVDVDVMRRAFVRLLGITPLRYCELADHSTGE